MEGREYQIRKSTGATQRVSKIGKRHAGFTLLECLIALVVLMGLLVFLVPFIQTIERVQKETQKGSFLEIQTGKIQLENEINKLIFLYEQDNKLYFKDEEANTVVIEQYQHMIRKTVGHQPIVSDVKQVDFSEKHSFIRMEIRSLDEEIYIYFMPCKKK